MIVENCTLIFTYIVLSYYDVLNSRWKLGHNISVVNQYIIHTFPPNNI